MSALIPFVAGAAGAQPLQPSYCVDASCARSVGAQVLGVVDPASGRAVALSALAPLPVTGSVQPAGGTGAAAATAAIASAGVYQTVFPAGSVTHGCAIQNPAANAVSLWVDFAGATGGAQAATSLEVAPGAAVACAFLPVNAVTARAASTIPFNAVRW